MNRQQIDELYNADLMHYGVKGMQWGVRRDRRQAARSAAKAAQDNARSLVKERKAKSNARFDKMLKDMEADEKRINAKFDAIKDKKLSELDAQAKNKVDRFIGRTMTKKVVAMDREAAMIKNVAKHENKYLKRERQIKEAHKNDIRKLEQRLDQKHKSLVQQRVKGKPFPENMKNFLSIDKQLTNELVQGYLELDAKHGIKG